MPLEDITPVILCGGAGKRLRPLSRRGCPKPFLKIASRYTMLQETMLRVRGCSGPLLVLNHLLKARVEANLAEIGIVPEALVLEPWGRNTAPALAAAALARPDDIFLVLPSDHWIPDPAPLLRAIESSFGLARDGWIVTFGIRPRGPQSGFGYISRGPIVQDGVHKVSRFVEKPQIRAAREMVRSGGFDWNSGIFLLSAQTALAEIEAHMPEILRKVRKAMPEDCVSDPVIRLGQDFADCPPASIDVALMERSGRVLVRPVEMAWSDLGSWGAVLQRMLA